MLKKIILVVSIALILFCLFYQQASIYFSTVSTDNYYSEYPLINEASQIASKNYMIKKLSDNEGYPGSLKNVIFYDYDYEEYVLQFRDDSTQIIISNNATISEMGKNSWVQRTSKSELVMYPEQYYAFEHSWQAKDEPVNIVNYHKRRFEWPSACPYIGIPICNGWMWYGNAFFEVEHKGEVFKFHLDTQYHLMNGYDGQVYKLSLPSEMNSQVAFLNVNSSSTAVSRSSGWYVIVPKSSLD